LAASAKKPRIARKLRAASDELGITTPKAVKRAGGRQRKPKARPKP